MNNTRFGCTIGPTGFPVTIDSAQRLRRSLPAREARKTRTRWPAAASSAPAPLSLRLARVARVGVHVVEGLATAALVFPWIGPPRKVALIRRWSARLLRMLAVDARVRWRHAEGMPARALIVANHISWLDIFLLNALQPARFIAKAEVRRWPVIGALSAKVGTLFIERERRHDTHKVNQRAADALANGDVVAVFPEGTTSDGTELLRFHASLLQPIVDADGHVVPVAIRYRTPAGEHSVAPAYAGGTSFFGSFWRLTGERRLVAELHIAQPVPARERHRRELSRLAEAAIRTALGLTAAGSAPGTRGDPRA